MKWIAYPSRDALFAGLAMRVATDISDALDQKQKASVAVPGGTTPGPMFDILAQQDLDWSKVTVMLSDERWVPQDHERSNARLLQQRLFVQKAAAANFLGFFQKGEAEMRVAEKSEAVEGLSPLDVLVVGMGTDMHTASLFPDAPELPAAMANDAPALLALRPAGQPDLRVSLSGQVLANAKSKHLLITGEEKKLAFEAAQDLPPSKAPIKVAMTGLTVHWAE